MKKNIALIIFLFSFFQGSTQTIKIGVWRDGMDTKKIQLRSNKQTSWTTEKGTYKIDAGKSIYFTYSKSKIRLSTANKVYGYFSSIESLVLDSFNLISMNPIRTEEIYHGKLSVTTERTGLKIINCFADIERYISGVVEAETGREQTKEFYKVQATISRTFALSNSRRHEAESFNLCDQVHCQVYHGISRFNDDIIKATKETAGEVIVDPDINLITASFHSNCGGVTSNSEDVWSKALPYLRSIPDPFCIEQKNAIWHKTISTNLWIGHLAQKYSLVTADNDSNFLLEYSAHDRSKYIKQDGIGIDKGELRHKWSLKSTYFDSCIEGDSILLIGKGYGHGVGLCQEGAMQMSKKGYSYEEILQFYYTDVHLIHRSMIDFFRDEW